jgi:hypothetical protein
VKPGRTNESFYFEPIAANPRVENLMLRLVPGRQIQQK